MNILFCADNNFASKLAVAMSSLLDTNQEYLDELMIYIRTNDMNAKSVENLQSVATRYGLAKDHLYFCFTDELYQKFEAEKLKKLRDSYVPYFKIFNLDDLPIKGDRLLALDCDILVRNPIKELYEWDLQGKAVGAVRDVTSNNPSGLGFEYNSGVVLYDMTKYRELHISDLMKEYTKKIPSEKWTLGDQDVFNNALQHNDLLLLLPQRYNFILMQTVFSYKDFVHIRSVKNYYNEEDYEAARYNPTIIHLITGDFATSPWYYEGYKPIKKIWDGYLEETPWKDEKDKVYLHLKWQDKLRKNLFIMMRVVLPHGCYTNLLRWLYKKNER